MSLIEKNEFGQVSSYLLSEQCPALKIEHQSCTAVLSLYGGQVLSWTPQGQKDVFWMSNSSEFTPGKAIRGGIPLCWPWFGPYHGSKNQNGGNHGFARVNLWRLEQVNISAEQVDITLCFDGESCHDLWPHAFSLKQQLSFGKVFSQQLHITNNSAQSVQYTGALHSYFNVSSPEQTSIDDLSEAKFIDKLADSYPRESILPNCLGPIDRVYQDNGVIKIIDQGESRIVQVTPSHTHQWVLWNPGAEIVKTMADIHEHGETEFVCLEAANTEWITIAPQQSVEMGQVIRVTNF